MNAIRLSQSGNGVRLSVHAQPGAKRNAIAGVHGDAVKVAVNAPPQDGKANDAVVQVIAQMCGVPPRQVTIIAGLSSRKKVVAIDNTTVEHVQRMISRSLEP